MLLSKRLRTSKPCVNCKVTRRQARAMQCGGVVRGCIVVCHGVTVKHDEWEGSERKLLFEEEAEICLGGMEERVKVAWSGRQVHNAQKA